MEIFINSTSAISPQSTFSEEGYLETTVLQDEEFLKCNEPDYKDYIDPRLSRRMARVIKMGVSTAIKSLREAGVENPGGIIIGTGLGCLKDTERFLTDIIENEEGVLSPTPFIQSTHNTIGGQIALMVGCNQYNYTYVHRGNSFESSLLDAIFKLEEGANEVLVGGVDESTQATYEILRRMGCISPNSEGYLDGTLQHNFPVLGEGSAFFVISKKQGANVFAKVSGVKTFYSPESPAEATEEVRRFLQKHGISPENIDVLLAGLNGVAAEDRFYHDVFGALFPTKSIVRFKNLSGEYQTVSSFAMNLASHMLKKQKVYAKTLVKGASPDTLEHILLYNHYKQKNHNLILLSKC